MFKKLRERYLDYQRYRLRVLFRDILHLTKLHRNKEAIEPFFRWRVLVHRYNFSYTELDVTIEEVTHVLSEQLKFSKGI